MLECTLHALSCHQVVGLEEDDDDGIYEDAEDDSPENDGPAQHQPAMRQRIDLQNDCKCSLVSLLCAPGCVCE